MPTPTPDDALRIVQTILRKDACSIARLPTGLCHHVYDVVLADGQHVVARLASSASAAELRGGIYWSQRLRPSGIPLPRMLACDPDGQLLGIPCMILERLPGTDLGHAYPTLTPDQKRSIALELAHVQGLVRQLPPGAGYGYTTGPQPAPHRTWSAVVAAQNQRSRDWLIQVGQISTDIVDRVDAACDDLASYLAQVAPTPFLDDTTTKNVLIHDGHLSGIVDVDEVCYGDPLFTVALTRASLLASGHDTLYTDAWCEALNLSPQQHLPLDLYTAVFLVTFISEQGMQFNKARPTPIDWPFVERARQLIGVLLKDACY